MVTLQRSFPSFSRTWFQKPLRKIKLELNKTFNELFIFSFLSPWRFLSDNSSRNNLFAHTKHSSNNQYCEVTLSEVFCFQINSTWCCLMLCFIFFARARFEASSDDLIDCEAFFFREPHRITIKIIPISLNEALNVRVEDTNNMLVRPASN